jgi:dTDP-4-dehydrorhamnose reductase
MKILITGGRGMLGRTLTRRFTSVGHQVIVTDRDELDITNARMTTDVIATAKPDAVVHCAAMTAVDACESDQDLAWRLNVLGSQNVAAACHRTKARCIAISTDYVFAGDGDRPYHEWDIPAPRTIYGLTKWQGEEAVRRHCPDHVIARIAWLYGPGGPSFVHTMSKLGAQDGPALKVVNDQIGNPTSTDAVATGLLAVLEQPLVGTVHLTCDGEATWYGFTQAIFAAKGLTRPIIPCSTAEYPRPAPRPANSRLEKRALHLAGLPTMPSWQDALRQFITENPNG